MRRENKIKDRRNIGKKTKMSERDVRRRRRNNMRIKRICRLLGASCY
jgi:hypothetical protein